LQINPRGPTDFSHAAFNECQYSVLTLEYYSPAMISQM